MTIQEFVSMQIALDNDPVHFDIVGCGPRTPYTIENADRFGPMELCYWEFDRLNGRMLLCPESGERVDLVSAELPYGTEF